jgi:hypothetical protein
MLGTDLDQVGWPQSGEIDIMENIGREPATTHGTVQGPGIFLLAALLALSIALLAVGYQSVRAALTDPVRALRHE